MYKYSLPFCKCQKASPCRQHRRGTDLTDVVPEDGLVLRSTNVSLEPGLRLAIVGDLQSCSSVTDLGKVGHCVPHCDGAINAPISTGRDVRLSVSVRLLQKTGRVYKSYTTTSVHKCVPSHIADKFLFVNHHTERTCAWGKHMQGFRVTGQLFTRGCSQDDRPASGLGHPVLPSLQKN